jgi:hypothetical protein
MFIRPLCFHADIVADSSASAANIGPYHGNHTVWHLHPFTFLSWMNERIDLHERNLAERDRPRPGRQSNIVVQNGYVTGFQNVSGNQLNAGASNYPVARYNENRYEVRLDKLADQAALATTAQQATRFNWELLRAADFANDRQHGLQIIEGFVGTGAVQCSDPSRHALHRQGDAVDFRPGNTNVASWYNLWTTVKAASDYLKEEHDLDLEMVITTDPDPNAATLQSLRQQAIELQRRILAATHAGDPGLTAAPAVQNLDRMRLHLGLHGRPVQPQASLADSRWSNTTSAQPGRRVQIGCDVSGLAGGTKVEVFVLGEIQGKTIEPDITGIDALARLYGSRAGDLNEIERHGMRPNTVDEFIERLSKTVTDVDADGNASLRLDWRVPDPMPHGIGSLYPVFVAAAGSTTTTGAQTAEHVVAPVGASSRISVPHVHSTRWATSATGPGTSAINVTRFSIGFVVVETRALPAGCTLEVSVRDTANNQNVIRETRNVAAGNSRTSVRVTAPQGGRNYHATVRVRRAENPRIDLTSGAGISWTD